VSPRERRKVRYLGLIPARCGSKGIPGKNLAELGGRPLLAWTLEAARHSRRLDRTLLTSDDPVMIALAGSVDIDAPFVRPAHLATDTAQSIDVVLHALDWLAQNGDDVEVVVLLQPTCPFRDAADVDAAIATYEASNAATLISVSRVLQHPCDMVTRTERGLEPAVAAAQGGGRQAFPDYFFIDGAVYIAASSYLRTRRRFWDESSATHEISPTHGIDIDEPYQLRLARGLLLTGHDGPEGPEDTTR
jgi:CMP-N,N'-diacetyllegionaminic acid synthase